MTLRAISAGLYAWVDTFAEAAVVTTKGSTAALMTNVIAEVGATATFTPAAPVTVAKLDVQVGPGRQTIVCMCIHPEGKSCSVLRSSRCSQYPACDVTSGTPSNILTRAHTEVNDNVARRVMLTLFNSRCESLKCGG